MHAQANSCGHRRQGRSSLRARTSDPAPQLRQSPFPRNALTVVPEWPRPAVQDRTERRSYGTLGEPSRSTHHSHCVIATAACRRRPETRKQNHPRVGRGSRRCAGRRDGFRPAHTAGPSPPSRTSRPRACPSGYEHRLQRAGSRRGPAAGYLRIEMRSHRVLPDGRTRTSSKPASSASPTWTSLVTKSSKSTGETLPRRSSGSRSYSASAGHG